VICLATSNYAGNLKLAFLWQQELTGVFDNTDYCISLLIFIAPATHRMGVKRGPSTRKCCKSHVPDGNDVTTVY